jgi:hypothetical protein
MKQLKLKLSALFLLLLFLFAAQAQEAVTASGGEATGTDGAVSYSVGQLVVSTNEGTDGSVAHGVQQPYEISIVVGIEEASGIDLILTAYPNPTKDLLKLKVENFDLDDLTYYLFSMNGNLLESKKIIDRETSIQMSKYLRGTYILKIISKTNEVKTFSIIKN